MEIKNESEQLYIQLCSQKPTMLKAYALIPDHLRIAFITGFVPGTDRLISGFEVSYAFRAIIIFAAWCMENMSEDIAVDGVRPFGFFL